MSLSQLHIYIYGYKYLRYIYKLHISDCIYTYLDTHNIGQNIHADDTTVMAESEEELKSLLMKVKLESEKVGLKLNIQKMKIMSSSPI